MTEIAFARPSSTVVLARAAAGRPEVFMVRRHARSSFGAAYAFPGGVIDPEDADVDQFCEGRDCDNANSTLALPADGIAYFVGAIRELFEETGVLLATCETSPDELELLRASLNKESLTWLEFLHATGARMLCDRLTYFSHWITPNEMARRYSTRFFAALMPTGQVAEHDAGELTDSVWISAEKALAAGKHGRMKLHYPTIKILESIAAHDTPEAFLEWAAQCESQGVVPIHPQLPAGASQ